MLSQMMSALVLHWQVWNNNEYVNLDFGVALAGLKQLCFISTTTRNKDIWRVFGQIKQADKQTKNKTAQCLCGHG